MRKTALRKNRAIFTGETAMPQDAIPSRMARCNDLWNRSSTTRNLQRRYLDTIRRWMGPIKHREHYEALVAGYRHARCVSPVSLTRRPYFNRGTTTTINVRAKLWRARVAPCRFTAKAVISRSSTLLAVISENVPVRWPISHFAHRRV